MKTNEIQRYAYMCLYLLSIPMANWLVNNVGSQTFANGPHTIPVGFGYRAPSGVLMIGIALFARDLIQEKTNRSTMLAVVSVGVAISFLINKDIAVASAVAFATSELCDLVVYSKIRRHNMALAVALSGIVGGIIDSFLFLQIAFGSTQFWQGQVIGKTLVACLCALVIAGWHGLPKRMPTI